MGEGWHGTLSLVMVGCDISHNMPLEFVIGSPYKAVMRLNSIRDGFRMRRCYHVPLCHQQVP
jgi:hypothetical protein